MKMRDLMKTRIHLIMTSCKLLIYPGYPDFYANPSEIFITLNLCKNRSNGSKIDEVKHDEYRTPKADPVKAYDFGTSRVLKPGELDNQSEVCTNLIAILPH